MNNVSEENMVKDNNESINEQLNNENDISTESLTVDYNNLYKLETKEQDNTKQKINQTDIQFDNEDYIQDQDIIRAKEKAQTKRNIVFMAIIFTILVITIIWIFPLVFSYIKL